MGEIFEKLGLGLVPILFHTINLIILIVALRFLLFKPVKKIITARNAKLTEVYEANDKLNREALTLKHEYDGMIEDAKKEASRATAIATEKAALRSNELIEEAKHTAENIVATGNKEVAAERLRLENEFKKNALDLSISIASKVISREIKPSDNAKLIEELIAEGKN